MAGRPKGRKDSYARYRRSTEEKKNQELFPRTLRKDIMRAISNEIENLINKQGELK